MIRNGLDSSMLQDLVDISPTGGLRLVRELIQMFFAEAPRRLDLMRCGLAANDPTPLRRAAHAMKGAAGNLGAVNLTALCHELECLGQRGDLGKAPSLVNGVERELHRLEQQLEAWSAGLPVRGFQF